MLSHILPILIRFLLGGAAVVAATLVARWFGGRVGGIFAAFPAVYLAAVLSLGLEYRGDALVEVSRHISQGALVGMTADIFCAIAASYLIARNGWKKGLVQALLIWCVIAPAIYGTWKIIA
ncbi:MAG TPA: DUF3147 family protein [Syntrophomonadaceae bacterium]|nr:DUF3147 family protein [Syntrophomonadaceae bacterium]